MGENRVRVDGDDETQRKEYDPWSTSEKETRRRHATGYLNLNLNSRLRHVQNMMGSNKPTLENRAPPPKPIVSRTRYFHAGG